MFFFQEGFTYRNFLMDVLAIFIFIVWFWLLITIFADLFRRQDICRGCLSIHYRPGLFNFSVKRYGRTQCAAGAAGA